MYYFSRVKLFWPVQNNQPITDAIKKRSNINKGWSTATYDLFMLSTNITNTKL